MKTDVGCDKVSEKESQVRNEMNILNKYCTALNNVIQKMEDRLNTVLLLEPPCESDKNKETSQVILADEIKYESGRINESICKLNSLIERIEL